MNLKTAEWTKRIDFFFLSAWLMTSLGAALISLLFFGVDFRGYYAAAQVLLAGGNPYDYHQVATVLLKVTREMGNNPYYYPPWFAWLFIPLAKLPFQIARAIWMLFNLIVWNVSIYQLSKLIHWPANGWKRYSIFILSTLTFAWITFRYEQAGILVLGMLVAFILSMQNQKWIQSGIWLALLLVKPNITLVVISGISLWLLRKGQWRPVLVMMVTTLALLVISTLIMPNWFKPFFEPGFGRGLTMTLDGPENIGEIRINTTMLDWMAYLGVEPNLRVILYGIFIPVAIFIFILFVPRSQSLLEVISLSILISCAITPYALQYDYPPLAITFFWALSLTKPTPTTTRISALLAGFIFYASMWDPSVASRYWMIVGLIALTLYALHQAKMTSKLPESFTPSHPP
jgi:hypothetical protein